MSKTEIVTEKVRDLKFRLFSRQSGICFSCGLPMSITEMEAAHRIPDRKWTVKLFGKEVIDHPKNFRGTHRGRCNSKAQLNPDSLMAEELAHDIQKELKKAKDRRYHK